MKTKLLFCAVLGTLTGLSYGDRLSITSEAPAAAESKGSLAESIEKEIKEYEAAEAVVRKKMRAEKDRKKSSALYRQMPSRTLYVERVLALVEKSPKDPAAKKGLAWSLTQSRSAPQLKRISDIFEAQLINDPLINEYARSLALGYLPQSAGLLRNLREKTTREDTKIYCSYYLAKNLEKQAKYGRNLSPEEKKAMSDEATNIFKQLNDDPKVAKVSQKLADRIATDVFEKENLAIGCTAPDIEGDDHTGTVFKLSDYRGKVVLLDFWGIW